MNFEEKMITMTITTIIVISIALTFTNDIDKHVKQIYYILITSISMMALIKIGYDKGKRDKKVTQNNNVCKVCGVRCVKLKCLGLQ